jgi:transposase
MAKQNRLFGGCGTNDLQLKRIQARAFSVSRHGQILRGRICSPRAVREKADEFAFDVVSLPTFETSQMVPKAARKVRSVSVRSLLTWKRFQFKQRLKSAAARTGKTVLDACEAYTSKTASWTGEVKHIGGAKTIKSGGLVVDRDLNGARGICLRVLVDTPGLSNQACSC